jgi:hypothetical protein
MLSQGVEVCHCYEGVCFHSSFLSYTGSYVERVGCKEFTSSSIKKERGQFESFIKKLKLW